MQLPSSLQGHKSVCEAHENLILLSILCAESKIQDFRAIFLSSPLHFSLFSLPKQQTEIYHTISDQQVDIPYFRQLGQSYILFLTKQGIKSSGIASNSECCLSPRANEWRGGEDNEVGCKLVKVHQGSAFRSTVDFTSLTHPIHEWIIFFFKGGFIIFSAISLLRLVANRTAISAQSSEPRDTLTAFDRLVCGPVQSTFKDLFKKNQ